MGINIGYLVISLPSYVTSLYIQHTVIIIVIQDLSRSSKYGMGQALIFTIWLII